jgi:hypothetical protein
MTELIQGGSYFVVGSLRSLVQNGSRYHQQFFGADSDQISNYSLKGNHCIRRK